MIPGTCRGFPCDRVRKVPCPPRAVGVDRRGHYNPVWGCGGDRERWCLGVSRSMTSKLEGLEEQAGVSQVKVGGGRWEWGKERGFLGREHSIAKA